MNLVGEQANELKAALGDIFVPAAQDAGEKFFQMLRDGTESLVENKDALQKWYFRAAEIFDTVSQKVGGFTDKVAEVAKAPKGTTGDAEVDKVMSGMGWRYQEFNKQKPFGVNTSWDKFKEASESYGIFGDEIERADEKYKAFNGTLNEANTVAGKMAQGIKVLSDAQKENGDVLSQYGFQRLQQFKDELEDVQVELEFSDDEFKKSLAQLDLWRQRELEDKLSVSSGERAAIEELYEARKKLIELEHDAAIGDRIQENLKNAADLEYEMTHTAFEKQIRDIELWEEAQREKAETAEEVQAIIAESAAKEAQAFENAVDRIKGKLQSLDDKIFKLDHSQYEQDLRRIQQEYLNQAQEYQELGMFMPEIKAKLDYLYSRQKQDLDKRAAESHKSGGDYTKAPEGARQGFGNGILVIESDQIVDDGLMKAQSQAIGLLTDENLIRQQLITNLDADARVAVERIQATKELTAAQQELIQSAQADGFQLIEGDKFAQPTAGDYQVITGDQVLAMPAQELQKFSEAVQQVTAPLNESADAQKSFAESAKNFPPEYFQNLADSAKSVSEMQLRLTETTLSLIDAQSNLAKALSNLPTPKSAQDISSKQPLPTDGFIQLGNSTQEVIREQDLLARTTRETASRLREISDIPTRRQEQEFTFKPGFDYDTAKDILLTGVGLSAAAASSGVGLAFSPEILAGSLLAAGVGGVLKGSIDETTAAITQPEKELSESVDLSALETSLASIDENLQSFLQSLQTEEPHESDRYQELFGSLPNIEEEVKNILAAMQSREEENSLPESLSSLPRIDESVQSILQTLQASKENPTAPLTAPQSIEPLTIPPTVEPSVISDYMTPLNSIDGKVQSILQKVEAQQPVTFETIITPLNTIAGVVSNMLTAMANRQPPQITIAPNNSIDLGGAYVFDNAMKQELVNDITKDIVDEITTSVRQAISQSSYGFSA